MANPRKLPGGHPDTKFQRWLQYNGACARGRNWVGGCRPDYIWKQFNSRTSRFAASDMAWLIYKLTDGITPRENQAFFTTAGGTFLATLAHRAGCDAVRAMCPWLPVFKYGEFQDWTRSQRNFLGATLAYDRPDPIDRPPLESDTAP